MKRILSYLLMLTILLSNFSILHNNTVLNKPSPRCEFVSIKK